MRLTEKRWQEIFSKYEDEGIFVPTGWSGGRREGEQVYPEYRFQDVRLPDEAAALQRARQSPVPRLSGAWHSPNEKYRDKRQSLMRVYPRLHTLATSENPVSRLVAAVHPVGRAIGDGVQQEANFEVQGTHWRGTGAPESADLTEAARAQEEEFLRAGSWQRLARWEMLRGEYDLSAEFSSRMSDGRDRSARSGASILGACLMAAERGELSFDGALTKAARMTPKSRGLPTAYGSVEIG